MSKRSRGERRKRRIARYSKRIASFDRSQKYDMAKFMRKNPTPGERFLWKFLFKVNKACRRERMRLRWNRQVIVHGYIADFHCCKLKAIIEVDGGHHLSAKKRAYDAKRDAILLSHGIKTYRIPWPFKGNLLDMRKLFEGWFGPLPYGNEGRETDDPGQRKALDRVINNPAQHDTLCGLSDVAEDRACRQLQAGAVSNVRARAGRGAQARTSATASKA